MTSRHSTTDATFTPASNKGDAKSRPIGDGFAPKDCLRIPGPTTPPYGEATPIHGVRNLEERLERLAFPSEEVLKHERAPMETYTTTSSEHGDIYRATDAYVAWLRSRIPGYGGLDRITRAAPGRETQGDGGTPGGQSAWLNGRMKKAS